MSNTYVINNIPRLCNFCNEELHETKKCPLEISIAPILKKKVGNVMEYFVANNLKCPECGKSALQVLGNNSPSFDIVCNFCDKMFEVKSKCLSVNVIPNDIVLPHGSYCKFIDQCNQGLNLIIVIYGIDRLRKNIIIREILYASNNELISNTNINVLHNTDNKLSTIFINDKLLLKRMVISHNNIISFAKEIEVFKNNLKN
jgi:hypothetical protein